MNLEWVQNNVHGLLTVWTVSGEADFDLVTTGDFSHEVNFPSLEAFTKDSVSEVLYAVDNTASLIAAHKTPTDVHDSRACLDGLGIKTNTVFTAIENELRERGIESTSYESDQFDDGCEKILEWSSNDVFYSLTAWAHSEDAYFTVAHQGMKVQSVRFEDIHRFELEAEDAAIGAVDNVANLMAASAVLNHIKAELEAQGLYPSLCNNAMDQGMSVTWYDAYSLTSIGVWLDEGTAEISSHQGGKTVFQRSLGSIEDLRLAYSEAIRASIAITAGGASC